jgi:hypothetical protein
MASKNRFIPYKGITKLHMARNIPHIHNVVFNVILSNSILVEVVKFTPFIGSNFVKPFLTGRSRRNGAYRGSYGASG